MTESDRVFTCPYCRVRLIVTASQYFSSYVPAAEKHQAYSFYVPYWRFKGIEFRQGVTQSKHKLIDRTICARTDLRIPHSLGYRLQAVKARFVEQKTEGVFLKPTLSLEHFLGRITSKAHSSIEHFQENPDGAARAAFAQLARSDNASDRRVAEIVTNAIARDSGIGAGRGDTINAFIGEIVSQVYWPYFYQGSVLYDGLTGTRVGSCDPIDFGSEARDTAQEGVRFVPTLCPDCGWSLEGTTVSMVLPCSRCGVGWAAQYGRLVRTRISFAEGGDSGDAMWLPFWRIAVKGESLRLDSFADLIQELNVPRMVTPAMKNRSADIWIPAFKIAPRIFLRIAGALTIAQLRSTKDSRSSGERTYPVTLSAAEAFESVPLVLSSCSNARKSLLPRIAMERFKPVSCRLTMVPFCSRGYEYVQSGINFSVHKNALKWGRAI